MVSSSFLGQRGSLENLKIWWERGWEVLNSLKMAGEITEVVQYKFLQLDSCHNLSNLWLALAKYFFLLNIKAVLKTGMCTDKDLFQASVISRNSSNEQNYLKTWIHTKHKCVRWERFFYFRWSWYNFHWTCPSWKKVLKVFWYIPHTEEIDVIDSW